VDASRASSGPAAPRAAIAALIVVVLVAIGAVVVAATGTSGAAAAQYDKVTLCHKGKTTITVGGSAAEMHRRHGDTPGPCP
jgi:hypothetical protein